LPGYKASAWFGIGAPKSTPAELIERLNKEVNVSIVDPKFQARLANPGGTVLAGSPADFGKLISDETKKWGKVILAANIRQQRTTCRTARFRFGQNDKAQALADSSSYLKWRYGKDIEAGSPRDRWPSDHCPIQLNIKLP
jgi:hypothetical protein